MNIPNLRTERDLLWFFNSATREILSKLPIESKFEGVRLENDYYRRKVIVHVPFIVHCNYKKGQEIYKIVQTLFTRLLSEVKGTPCYCENIDVKIDIVVEDLPEQVSIEYHCFSNDIVERRDYMYIPEVVKIIHKESKKRGELFTVYWSDNTTTTVKLREGDTSDEYTAYLYALGKKIFGDKGTGRKFVRDKKKVFEDELAEKYRESQRKRNEQKLLQSLNSEDSGDYIPNVVYDQMFVPPALISKSLFRRNN